VRSSHSSITFVVAVVVDDDICRFACLFSCEHFVHQQQNQTHQERLEVFAVTFNGFALGILAACDVSREGNAFQLRAVAQL
jgi:hypothetical protein